MHIASDLYANVEKTLHIEGATQNLLETSFPNILNLEHRKRNIHVNGSRSNAILSVYINSTNNRRRIFYLVEIAGT